MKLCASYHTHNEALSEIRYPLSALNLLVEALFEKPQYIYILEILNLSDNETQQERLINLANENKNLVIDCYEKRDYVKLANLVPHIMYHYPAVTYNDICWLLAFKPWAITIAEPLAFDCKKVRQVIDRNTPEDQYIYIRVLPALGRPGEWGVVRERNKDNGVKHFFIVPQFMHIYEPYIDVLDLYDMNADREATLVKIYAQGECRWGLHALLKHCECTTPCQMLDEDFFKRRLNCGQRCMQGAQSCDYCNRETKVINAVIASQS